MDMCITLPTILRAKWNQAVCWTCSVFVGELMNTTLPVIIVCQPGTNRALAALFPAVDASSSSSENNSGLWMWHLKWDWPVWWLHGLRLLPQHGGSSRRSMHGFSPCCLSRVSVLNPFVEGWIVVFWCECFICPEAAGALPVWCTIMPPVFSTAMSTLTCHACLLRSFRE